MIYHDSYCGVNRQWCLAARHVPNAIVHLCPPKDSDPKVFKKISSFALAIRKHLRGISSFIEFPVLDLQSLLDDNSCMAILSKVRSLSLSFDIKACYSSEYTTRYRKCTTRVHEMMQLCQRLAALVSLSSQCLNR
jgi:hypothetical protein